jgi:hypothetical protein
MEWFSQLPINWGVSPSLPYPAYWASTWPLCRVSIQACPNKLAWRFTQHNGQGLDHFVRWCRSFALTGLLGALPNILGKHLSIMLGGCPSLPLTGLVGALPNITGKGLIILLGGVQACPNGLAWCLTQHWHGLDRSVGWVSKLVLTGLVGTLLNILGKGLIILLGSVQACPNGLAWCLTQNIQQGLDHFVGWMSKLALMGLLGALSNILGKGLMIMLGASTSIPSTFT